MLHEWFSYEISINSKVIELNIITDVLSFELGNQKGEKIFLCKAIFIFLIYPRQYKGSSREVSDNCLRHTVVMLFH